jgi:hypothetical protein
MSPGVIGALRGELPLGGDQGRHAGIDALAGAISRALAGAVVYENGLGWELAFYLGESPRALIVHSPQPEALADEMRGRADIRYFVAPSAAHAAPWLDALARDEITVRRVELEGPGAFALYALSAR